MSYRTGEGRVKLVRTAEDATNAKDRFGVKGHPSRRSCFLRVYLYSYDLQAYPTLAELELPAGYTSFWPRLES